MELNDKQQTVELLKKSKNVLLVTHVNPDGDALGSLLALHMVLKKLDKNVTAVSTSEISEVYRFLPKIEQIESKFSGMKDFIVSIDLVNSGIEKLSYKKDVEQNKLNIIVSPKNGNFSPEDVSFRYGKNKYDLIIVLDAPTLDRVGGIYDENAELFYETPIINIDHHPGNDHFGKVNWVDLTATSTAEILVSLIESVSREKQLLDADVATCLLTGITTDTASFQNTNTTPKSLTIAAQLVAAGARQQEIIRKIYKTRQLTTLKLWGRVLSRIKQEPEGFVWSYATKKDLEEVGAGENETSGVIDELIKTVPGVDFALLLTERSNGVHGSFRSTSKNVKVVDMAHLFGGGGHEQAAAFRMDGENLDQVKDNILSKIKGFRSGSSMMGEDEFEKGIEELELPEGL